MTLVIPIRAIACVDFSVLDATIQPPPRACNTILRRFPPTTGHTNDAATRLRACAMGNSTGTVAKCTARSLCWACWLGDDSPEANQFARHCEDLSSDASKDRSRVVSRLARPKSRRTLAKFRARICRSQAALGRGLTAKLVLVAVSLQQRLLDYIRSVELGLILSIQTQTGQEQ